MHKYMPFICITQWLMGKGIGYVDVHLLASAAIAAGVKLWTRDKRLVCIAAELRYAWKESAQE